MRLLVLLLGLVYACHSQNYTFPADFEFGLATASYQVEGAWNVSGKGENIWDRLTHTRSYLITDGSNGDIASDAYHRTFEDVARLVNFGVNFYRFSLSWSRLLPTGHLNLVNPDGIRYYNELINELLANNIDPFVTIFHWDLPQPLQEIGGWPNPDIAQSFKDYAHVSFTLFGDRVKNWITFNEPAMVCDGGYGAAHKAPAYPQAGIGCYRCAHTLLIAHGLTYQHYNQFFREGQGGRVGITIDSGWYEPESDSIEDVAAAELVIQVNYGWFANPIFSSEGDYPQIMKDRIALMSLEEGFPTSRLPEFTPEQVELIRGSADFLGLNHYTTQLCSPIPAGWGDRPSHWTDAGGLCYQPDEWEPSASDWLKVVPWGFRKILNWIKNNYNDPEIVVTENGFSDAPDTLHDCRRVNYYNSYLEQLLLAINEDNVNVTGYTAWSFMDNFEWMEGYTERFGVTHVNFTGDTDRPRTAKYSAYIIENIFKTRQIDWNYHPANSGFPQCQW